MALLLLRFAAALFLSGASYLISQDSPDVWLLIVSALAALALLLGVGTRIVALVCAVVAFGVGATLSEWHIAVMTIQGFNFAALALLGAGAYSIDAYLFGRRVIKLEG